MTSPYTLLTFSVCVCVCRSHAEALSLLEGEQQCAVSALEAQLTRLQAALATLTTQHATLTHDRHVRLSLPSLP
jgi:hypothetical protein